MLDTLDAAAVRRWCAGGLVALRRHQGEIDDLNVYPVPDGDTGTNMVLTLTSAQQALAMDLGTLPEDGPTAHGHALRLMARGALLGARGNSGVILSQILRGFADAVAAVPAVRGRELAAALRDGTAAAYAAVARPVEGTLLSVVAAAAHAAERADSADLCAVARAAAGGAAHALARTPEQLPALARAGVVDAGGRGLCLLLDALVEVVTGERPERPAPAPRPVRAPAAAVRETGSEEYAYEVQYLLDAGPEEVARLRAELAALGDSLVVVGDGNAGTGTWNVHVHVNDVGAAIEAGVVAGRPHRISVTRFADQAAPVSPPVAADGRAAVVVAAGAGIAGLFAGEGAAVVPGNPSIGELVEAIRATGAARVVVLPNDPDTQAVASAAAREAHTLGIKVSVVPTRSPVQALAALAVRDPGRRFSDDVIAMAEAAGACRYAEVCYARREALTVAGPCRPGDVLALVEGEVHLIGSDLTDTCAAVVDRMLGGGGELVTLLAGADAPAGLADAVREHVGRRWPFVEVQAYPGGQPHYPLLVGVE
ncbi:DAK2 domain-containing protein [Micromonospora sp. C31]|uniref:DAK2 domain-containing protein n=1 Tax=Micromonospora sp. C31 TaxID=2824876 RepID=UPI001B395FCB|nr:DAK2 domain-containing protein [Micromonospora sp. C31]MBQ1075277.1 DAK2 domain-containing protein [Micromonospora sp. C31]